jgi:hypothetical protein
VARGGMPCGPSTMVVAGAQPLPHGLSFSWPGMAQQPSVSRWGSWPKQPPKGVGRGTSRRMITRWTSEFMDLATFICIWTFVTYMCCVYDYVTS